MTFSLLVLLEKNSLVTCDRTDLVSSDYTCFVVESTWGECVGNGTISICNEIKISPEIERHNLSALMSKFVYLLFSQSAYVFIKVCS